jgi:hypothetical protein
LTGTQPVWVIRFEELLVISQISVDDLSAGHRYLRTHIAHLGIETIFDVDDVQGFDVDIDSEGIK